LRKINDKLATFEGVSVGRAVDPALIVRSQSANRDLAGLLPGNSTS
jgi:hypothetical protein